MELEHERDGRLKAEETIHELHVQLERANARVAELMAKLAAEESARADLEHMRRALHAAGAGHGDVPGGRAALR